MAKELICEAECPACGEIVRFYELGWTTCPHCESTRTELTLTEWEIIEEEQ